MKHVLQYKFSILAGLGILYLCLIPPSQIPKTEMQNADKIVHFAFYLCFGIAISLDNYLSKKEITVSTIKIIKRAIFLISFGIAIEAIQYLTPYRTASFSDILANSAGTLIYIAGLLWQKRHKKI